MTVPTWWSFFLLAAGSFRIWRLLAEDTILDRPRHWLVRLGNDWRQDGDPIPDGYRAELAIFLTCPWCLGFWVVLAVWGFWQWLPHGTEVVMTPLALSAAVGIIRGRLDPPE